MPKPNLQNWGGRESDVCPPCYNSYIRYTAPPCSDCSGCSCGSRDICDNDLECRNAMRVSCFRPIRDNRGPCNSLAGAALCLGMNGEG